MSVEDEDRGFPTQIWYGPGLPCRMCGRQPWNTFEVAMRPPEGWVSSEEYSAKVAEWRCGVTGSVEAADEDGVPSMPARAEAFCCDCGHRWWSRHPAALRAAVVAHGGRGSDAVTLSWEEVEEEREWAAMNEECMDMLEAHRARAAEAAARLRIRTALERFHVAEVAPEPDPAEHRFLGGTCLYCGREQRLAERFAWRCG